jgi:hypothetical protein
VLSTYEDDCDGPCTTVPPPEMTFPPVEEYELVFEIMIAASKGAIALFYYCVCAFATGTRSTETVFLRIISSIESASFCGLGIENIGAGADGTTTNGGTDTGFVAMCFFGGSTP